MHNHNWINKRILFCLLVTTVGVFCAYADDISVLSLEGGNCWLSAEGMTGQNGEDGTKVVSFPEGISTIITVDMLSSLRYALVNNWLPLQSIKGKYYLYLLCNYQGALLSLNLHNGDQKLCVHLKLSPEAGAGGAMEITGVFSNPETSSGFCVGARPGMLLLNLKKEYQSDSDSCVERLNQKYGHIFTIYSGYHDEYDNKNIVASNGVYTIKITDTNYYYREDKIIDLLLNDNSTCSGLVNFYRQQFEYNQNFLEVGSVVKVTAGVWEQVPFLAMDQ
ncbi:MAG: hypothetical protein HQK53_04820 [Oligoflexia bacterium]|nr:hypothetical protein [Oligoflexia bacterium]